MVFDLHFDTMVLLTNEKLRMSALNEADFIRYRAEVQARIEKENEKETLKMPRPRHTIQFKIKIVFEWIKIGDDVG